MKSILALTAAVLALPPAAAQTRPQSAQPTHQAQPQRPYARFTLPNGLTTIVHTDRTSPSVFVGIWYRTGSRDEPAGKTGFAHLFEHLMFQGTAHRKQELGAAFRAIGAIGMNGVTRTDHTAYYETVPTNALDAALWLESDRMGYLDGGITQAALDEQRSIVLNEKRQGELRPEEAAWRHFLSAFYPADHPYAHPTIGSTADIEAASLGDVKSWFASHYGAGNAVLVLSGDIDADTAREKVARYFGGIRTGLPISRPVQWAPPRTETRRDRLYGAFPATHLSRSWSIPNGDPRERTLLLLAARAMAGSMESPLVRALVTDGKVATGVSATLNEGELGSVLQVSLDLRPGASPEAAGQALDAALADYRTHGPAAERLATIIAATDTAVLRMLENPAAIGNMLGDGEIAHADPAYFLRQREWIKAATPEEVRAIGAKWLDRPYYELLTLPTPATPQAVPDVDRSRMPQPGPFKSTIVFPAISEQTLPNGLKLVVARRPGVGMVDFSLQFAGDPASPGYPRGTGSRALALLASGTPSRSGAPVSRRLAAVGTSLSADSDDGRSAIRWGAANAAAEESLDLVGDLLRKPPPYPAAAVAEANATARGGSEAAVRNPSGAGPALLRRAIWGDPDGPGTAAPSHEGVAITREMLLDYHGRRLAPTGATLYIVGDITPERARAMAEHAFEGWHATGPAPAAAPPAEPRVPAAPRLILVDAPGAAQTSITVGAPIAPFDRDQSAVEALATATLADISSGRLNLNLRQDKGWSYGFGGGIDDSPAGPRLFLASGSVQADRTGASIAELHRELNEIATTRPITQGELDAHSDAMIRSTVQSFVRNDAFLGALTTAGSYGLPWDRAATTDRRLAAVTLPQVQAASRALFRPDGQTWIVIGDRKTIEPQVRALGIAQIEIWDTHGRKRP